MKSLFKKIALCTMVSISLNLSLSCKGESEASPEAIKAIIRDEVVAQKIDFKLFTLHAMEVVKAPLSKLRREVTADYIAQVAEQRLSTDEERKYWIAVLGRESRFFQGAKSPVGAIGIGQIMPQFGEDFARACGFEDYTTEDVNDVLINLHISACFFKSLNKQHGGFVQLALASYNAGASSPSLKNYKNLGSMAHETANYVSSIWLIASLTEQRLNTILSFKPNDDVAQIEAAPAFVTLAARN